MQRGDSGDWVATTLNTPIVRGDAVATSEGSRAEVQLDYANVLRLSGQTQAKLADLTRSHIQVQISQGSASLSTFANGEAEVEVDTPNVAIHPSRGGRYRIEVNSDSETNVIVREGEAEISTSQGSTTVKAGEIISVRGTDDPEYKVSEAPGADDWDHWNNDRDKRIQSAEGVRRTNPYYTGAHDLDAYGRWSEVPGYGQVWAPYDQPATWAPYQAGQWVWEPYYGWTWVSYEPWGWAPYHYGRWFFYGSSWYWWPGRVSPFYRPVWSPAFVSFVGFGRHVGVGFGFGSIGWFPCGPFDPFYPWWGGGFNTFGFVGVGFGFGFHDRDRFFRDRDGFRGRGFSNFNMAFNNARVRAGITSVSAENFGRAGGRFEHGMDMNTLREARVSTGNIGVVPTHESLAPTNRGFRSAPAGIRSNASTHFFSRTQPSGSTPSFREQTSRMQEAVRAHGGEVQGGARAGMNTSSNGRFGVNNAGAGGDSHTFSGRNQGSSSSSSMGSGNAGRTDRPADAGRTVGGNQGGTSPNNSGGNRGGYQPFSRGSQGGTSNMGGGSRPQLDLSKRIVVPRSESNVSRGASGYTSGYSGSGNYGGRGNSGGGYSNRSYSSGGRSSGGGSSGSRGSSGGHSSGGHSSGGHSSSSHSGGGRH